MRRDDNFFQVRKELQARNVPFALDDNWSSLLLKLKQHEGNDKYFLLVTGHDQFIEGQPDREDEEIKVQFAKMRKNEANIVAIREELTLRNVMFDKRTTWKDLLAMLKENEQSLRSFVPLLPKQRFVMTEPQQQG